MDRPLPDWVADAAALPVAFAQVREDALLDLAVVRRVGARARVFMVASGGCTAAALAACGTVARLHLVDPNPAQLNLTRLKLHLLQTAEPAERLALLGHAPMGAAERGLRLVALLGGIGLPADALGPPAVVAELGPDQAGRYERVFAALRAALAEHADALADLLRGRDPAEQAWRVEPATALGGALDAAFDRVMSLPVLVQLFGEGATRNRVEPFARHFARRTRHALATLPAADNPYLWQVLLGRYPPGVVTPWLAAPPTPGPAAVTWANGLMADALPAADGPFDFVHLSNILDWLSPAEAAATLESAAQALRPGGWVLVRQLNSILDVPVSGRPFDWRADEAAALHASDRSNFYRGLHLGRRR